jgi:hypothetical protein
MKNTFLQTCVDYVVHIKCQQIAHVVRYGSFCKDRNSRHLALVGSTRHVRFPIVAIHIIR